MPRLIKDGSIVDDAWLPLAADNDRVADSRVHSLEQWEELDDKAGSAVQIEPGESIVPLLPHLADIALVCVHFPVFTDGRGFSYGRELRERGYSGELRAVGEFLPDQLDYLGRCGFNAFQFNDESQLEEALELLSIFSEHYQASIAQPQPLFRRRA